MSIADLVRMSNQIAANFSHHEAEQAAAETAYHLERFWTPRMLDQLAAHARADADDLDPLVVDAIGRLRAA